MLEIKVSSKEIPPPLILYCLEEGDVFVRKIKYNKDFYMVIKANPNFQIIGNKDLDILVVNLTSKIFGMMNSSEEVERVKSAILNIEI